MSEHVLKHEYIKVDGAELFTAVLIPDSDGKYPTVIMRSPYVDRYENKTENEILEEYHTLYSTWLENGYAVVSQHCRGRGKSTGDCIPYINEREDGLALQAWIRCQSFYNGELFLSGASYTTSVHYATAPFAPDIKGAVFGVQDSERYNICYRNGFLKRGLHGSWYVGMYKAKSHMKKNYTDDSFNTLPLSEFSKTVFGESAEDFDALIKAPNRDNEFWNTRFGGAETRGATDNADFPILLTTAFYDIYTGGIFDMWNSMSEKTKSMSALLVSPYNHGDSFVKEKSLEFENGKRTEQFGNYSLKWFDHIRGKITELPFEKGKVTYYSLFENKWKCGSFDETENKVSLKLGDKAVTYTYNPYDPPKFKGGLSRAFGGSEFQDAPNSRHDIISVFTEPFEEDTTVKGKITAKLSVSTDCEDTCFYIRISIPKEEGYFGLRDDITSILFEHKSYRPGEKVTLNFECDEHAFLIKKGEKLRIDIASADNEHYVRHTNTKGLFSEQTTAKIAHNTVYLNESFIVLPTEK